MTATPGRGAITPSSATAIGVGGMMGANQGHVLSEAGAAVLGPSASS